MDLALSGAFDPDQKVHRAQFINELFNRLRSLPGVQDVGGTNSLPLENGPSSNGTYVVMNPAQISPATLELINRSAHVSPESDPKMMKDLIAFMEGLFHDPTRTGDADYVVASEGYFRTLDIPLKRGRLFDDRDSADAPHVALVSESLVRQKWPNEDPLGRSIEFGNMDGDLRLLTVVGVVGDVRERSMEGPPRPTIYVNYRQRPQTTRQFSVVMRSSMDASVILPQAQRIVRELDPQVPPTFSTFSRVIAASLNTRRFNLILVGIFAVAATLLAVAGIYGVLAYSVARRTREIGVRIALGATAGNVLKLVLRQAMLTALAGVVVGTVFAFALTRLMRALLFEVSATDPLTFAAVGQLLLTVALLAAYLPARRATRVDPLVALRYE
jgi:predicted permease